MRNMITCLVVVLIVFIYFSSSFAGNTRVTTLDQSGIMQIRYASEAPDIDGEMDDIWLNTTAEQMLKVEGDTTGKIFAYDDHYSACRILWDEDYLYLFVCVVDDTLKTDINITSPWMNDCVELFIDGGNEKASSYDANDVQWRWVYPETVEDHPATGKSPGQWAWYETSCGYNFELRISADSLASRFDLESDTEIGLEISNGDLETPSSPQTVLHWWTNVATTWNDPSLFGTAILTEKEVSPILEISYAEDTPIIDGEMTEDEGWELADEISLTRFEGAPDVYPQDSIFTDWTDHVASFWALWDEDYFYAFVKVIDDSLKTDINITSPWMNDCIELFFDGGNEKATSYDANDVQWRWVYPETVEDHPATGKSPGEWVWQQTELGYDFELRISADSLASRFLLEDDTEIGFEVSNGDLETPSSPQRVLHWWTNVATTWNDPSLFGTAVLVGGSDAIGDNHSLVSDFELGQNYPNPFNPATKIAYSLGKAENVKLIVYNLLGQEISVLVNGQRTAGKHIIEFNGANLPSGIYFYTLQTGDRILTNKMVLIK
jgi:hypothetical protein